VASGGQAGLPELVQDSKAQAERLLQAIQGFAGDEALVAGGDERSRTQEEPSILEPSILDNRLQKTNESRLESDLQPVQRDMFGRKAHGFRVHLL